MSGAASRPARARLERRLDVARHAAELLDRRQRIMADELERLHEQADASRAEWERAARSAARWGLRAAAIDGPERIREAAPPPAEVSVRWVAAMGAMRPEEIDCRLPAARSTGGSAALALSALAHRDAVSAGVRHAVLEHARAALEAELRATQVRRRAVERRWMPRLDAELGRMREQLGQQELEETLRVRWAAERVAAADRRRP